MSLISMGINSQSSIVTTTTYSLFANTDVPSIEPGDSSASSGLQLGTYFKSSVSGFVKSARFYKYSLSNTNSRYATLFRASDAVKLGQINMGDISALATGWYNRDFASPIAIAANTEYCICIFYADMAYPASNGYFGADKVSGVLTAPITLALAGVTNGAYNYTTDVNSMPTNSFNHSNYWSDIVFSTT